MVTRAAGIVLFGAFLYAGSRKAASPAAWYRTLRQHQLAGPVRFAAFAIVPWVEIGTAVVGVTTDARTGGLLALAMLAAFVLAILRVHRRTGSQQVPCGCFGGMTERDYREVLVRNGALAALALLVVVAAPEGGVLHVGGAAEVALAVGVACAATLWASQQLQVATSRRRARAEQG